MSTELLKKLREMDHIRSYKLCLTNHTNGLGNLSIDAV